MTEFLKQIKHPRDLKKLNQDDLILLAEEIRQEIISVVTQTGGHLGSNLGVVELTMALHYVYEADRDVFVWDVSNQTYVHKMLTGRRERMSTIRQYGGLSGFGFRPESPYDPFTFGHAGTALSAALGLASADHLSHRDRQVVAVVGDGAMTCGITYEAMNNAGALKRNLLVILNDNTWSISPTVGALSNYLNDLRTAPLYNELKSEVKHVLDKLPGGHQIEDLLERVRRSVKATVGWNLFEALGFQYYGPIDGHDVKLLIRTLRNVRTHQNPVLLHVITQKGKGHPDAAKDPMALHGVSPRSKESKVEAGLPAALGDMQAGVAPSPKVAYTKAFTKSMLKLAEQNRHVAAITAAMPEGTGLLEFAKQFPDRYFDVGICEQHAVAFSAGLAHAGLRPVAALYSTFLQRGYDQIFQEVCIQNVPVVFAMDRAGIAGADGPTHNGLFDIAYLRTLPNMVLMAPKDAVELEQMLALGLTLDQPSAVRYPRANVPDFSKYGLTSHPLAVGKAEIMRTGRDGAILAYGAMVEIAMAAAEKLSSQGIELTVVNARFAKPVDAEMIEQLAETAPFVITLEDHTVLGGFGSTVLEAAAERGADLKKIKILGVPDRFLAHGDRAILLAKLGLDSEGVCNAVHSLIETGALPKPDLDAPPFVAHGTSAPGDRETVEKANLH